MTGTGLTRLAIIGFVIAALEPDVNEFAPAPAWLDTLRSLTPAMMITGVLFLIALRIRQYRLAQKRDKDWRARRDLRSRGA